MTGVEPIELWAGRVAVELRGCELAYACLGEQELVRRIYVAVRTERWDTVQSEAEVTHLEISGDEFLVGRTSRNRDGPIDFRWEGLIEGWPDGQLSFSMNGEALSAFSYGRIGLCALHASSDYAGKPFVARYRQTLKLRG